MSESSSFSSLLALVDSHLSKVNVQSSHSEDAHNVEDKDHKQNKVIVGTQSDTGFPYGASRKLAIPSFSISGNPVKNVLAEQVANMLKAKQQKEDLKKLSEEMKAIHISADNDAEHDVIDLMEALRTPFKIVDKCNSSHSSTESLFEPTFIECDDESDCNKVTLLPAPLPCHTDLSYILDFKVPQAKCSSFGKVLVSRFRPFLLPYKRQISHSSIEKFDFKSKSPCDILQEKYARKNSYK